MKKKVVKKNKPVIWVLDDDEALCTALQYVFDPDYEVEYFLEIPQMKKAIAERCPDVLILDLMFKRDESAGLKYLQELRKTRPYLPVVICSVRDDVEAGLIAGKHGVTKFVVKMRQGESFSEEIRKQVQDAFDESVLDLEIAKILEDGDFFTSLTGKSLCDCDSLVQSSLRCLFKCIQESGPSVNRLSKLTGKSVGTLNNHFKDAFKQSVGDFITYLAVLVACRIWLKGYSVAQAAAYVGMSPERFRQRVQAEFGKPPSAISYADLP